jgi:two-component system response regulator
MNKTILLAEDSSSDEKLTLVAFKKCNVASHTVVVRDGAEALDYLLLRGKYENEPVDLPTVLLLDLQLPRIDGLEVLRQVRAHKRTRLLPVVILTASREERDVVQGFALGANAYVRKPVDFSQFLQAAEALGFFWLILNEQPPQQRA